MTSRLSLYQQIIQPIEDRMIRSIWRITQSAADADDAMQEALLVIWRRRHRLSHHSCPQALVLKICIDAACDVTRRRARHQRKARLQAAGAQCVDGARLPLEEIVHRELAEEVQSAMGRLSRSQAVAISLRIFEELPYEEIAKAMNCSAATARKHVQRARERLQILLAKHCPGHFAGA
jgi:RNA polymerase sigma-70 factor (ECF subfamily)